VTARRGLKQLVTQFVDTGRDIFIRGLISSHAGNMSVRVKDRIYITRRSSMLGRLTEKDIIEVDLFRDDLHVPLASTELVVHEAIYRQTDTLAVVHTHPPYATLLSMSRDEILPVDSEGSYLFERAPIVSPKVTIGSEESAILVSEQLKEHKVVLVKSHGSFARGNTLEEAFMYTTSLESSSFYLYHLASARRKG
jgi:L-fuculose-phosphate aldolase